MNFNKHNYNYNSYVYNILKNASKNISINKNL